LWYADYNIAGGSLNFTNQIRMSVATMLQMFGPSLDIVYPMANQTVESLGYKHILYWNDPGLIPNASAIPLQNSAGNESAWQFRTPTPQSPSPINATNSTNFYAVGICALALCVISIYVLKIRKTTKTIKT
jgi:hypothetical protein